MKICFFNTREHWGGGEQWCFWAATGLRERGHEVRVIASPRSVLGDRCAEAGLAVERVKRGIFMFFAVGRIFRSFSPDLVLCNTGGETRAAVLARGSRPLPRIVLRRGLCRGIKSGLLHGMVYRRVDGFICNSQATLKEMTHTNPWIADRKPVVVYNPVPPHDPPAAEEVTEWRKKLGLGENDFVVLTVGRCDPDKGHLFLVQAFEKLVEQKPGAHLVIAGDGPELAKLEAMASAPGLSGRVHLCGFVARPGPLYALAHMMVMPSLPSYESFSNAALEGLGFGLPLVASSVGGFPELIEDGVDGLIVPHSDAGALEAAMVRLACDDDFRAKVAAAGQNKALTHFDRLKKIEELEGYMVGVVSATD